MRIPIETPAARRWAPGPWTMDAVLYGVSALFAGVTARVATIPLQRSWGRAAVWPYGIAAMVAAVAAWSDAASHDDEARHHRRRTILVLVVFAATALAPMTLRAVRRADDPAYAQSEVIIVEEAARAALHGEDPYAAEYRDGPLSDRPAATQAHFAYLPAMLVFGVPRAAGGSFPWADARVWFTVAALVAAALGLAQMRTAPATRIRTFQVLFALPTGALLLATGGVDIPVIAMLLATAVFARSERPVAAGVLGGLALASKQTSILVLPFFVLALPAGPSRRRFVASSVCVAGALIVPFVLWDVGAFVEDAILFPLNLGQGESAAAMPTLGSLLLDLAPTHRTAVTVLLVAVIVGVAGLLLIRKRTPSMAQACGRAAGAFLTAVALAPAARAGYLVYPINLIVWALAFRGSDGEVGS